ncbi:MAG TPA: hypothetical protein VFL91_13080 [Thermomicrobiales bacterium]|nr:hypothetical protein [Thermomicrobiales bacterium]
MTTEGEGTPAARDEGRNPAGESDGASPAARENRQRSAPPNRVSRESNPWLATAGCFADDDTLVPMLREIYAARDPDDARGVREDGD